MYITHEYPIHLHDDSGYDDKNEVVDMDDNDDDGDLGRKFWYIVSPPHLHESINKSMNITSIYTKESGLWEQ